MSLADLLALYLRPPAYWSGSFGSAVPVFDPPLTTAEQATFSDLQTMANFGVTMSLSDWQAVKSDAASLKAYYGLASPTNAQSVAAIKSIIHVLSVIVRD